MRQASESLGDAPGVSERLRVYAELLRKSPHNLLSPRGLEELEERHFPESLAFSARLPSGPRLLDVGSGGGLPGMVTAVARPDLEVHLLDATRKKTDFLREAAVVLGLPVHVHHGRAEELGSGELRASFDIVTARAVAPLERLIPWAAPFLKVGGELHAIKGERWAEELAAAGPEIRRLGLSVLSTPDPEPSDEDSVMPLVVVVERRR